MRCRWFGWLLDGVQKSPRLGNSCIPHLISASQCRAGCRIPHLPTCSKELYGEATQACGASAFWNATEGGACGRALDKVYAASELTGPVLGLGMLGFQAEARPEAGLAAPLRYLCPPPPPQPTTRRCPAHPASPCTVSGLNLYDVLESCYHGHNPYARQEQLSAALASHRQWPLGGRVREGLVPGFADLFGEQLGHTPPCLDSR